MKLCKSCNTPKENSLFNIFKKSKDGLSARCKNCNKIYISKYYKTKNGLIAKIHGHQVRNSIQRNQIPPSYSTIELREWMKSQTAFHSIFEQWENSNYDPKLIPSCDRKNDYLPYTFNNIEIKTWKDNKAKGHKDRKNGINNKDNKEVFQYTKEGVFVSKYHSQIEAERQTGIANTSISYVCRGIRKTAGGFKWNNTGGVLF